MTVADGTATFTPQVRQRRVFPESAPADCSEGIVKAGSEFCPASGLRAAFFRAWFSLVPALEPSNVSRGSPTHPAPDLLQARATGRRFAPRRPAPRDRPKHATRASRKKFLTCASGVSCSNKSLRGTPPNFCTLKLITVRAAVSKLTSPHFAECWNVVGGKSEGRKRGRR